MLAYFSQGLYPLKLARSFIVNPPENQAVELTWGQWTVPESADNDDYFEPPKGYA